MALFVEINVMPSSGRQEIKKTSIGLKCFLKAQPERGKANEELIRFLADKLEISRDDITITSGQTGHKKRIKLDVAWGMGELMYKLGLE